MIIRLVPACVVVLVASAVAWRVRNAVQGRGSRRREDVVDDRDLAIDITDDRVVEIDITPDTSRVTKSLRDLVFKATTADNHALWEAYFGRKLTPWEQMLFANPGLIDRAKVAIPPHNMRSQRLCDMHAEEVAKAVNDMDWWAEDSTDRYPGRGGW